MAETTTVSLSIRASAGTNLPSAPAMMKPWRIRTAATERIDLLFEPEFERISENGTPDSHFVNTHQMFGRYSGRIAPDNGGAVELRDLFGWIEDHEARW